MKTAISKVPSRNINDTVVRELWARAAGRCQFHGCNRILYKSPVTQENVNISEKAHIYSFSTKGPRGQGIYKENPQELNNIDNLMLVCHDCHKLIDNDIEGEKYSVELLQQWKQEHEQRIAIVTGIVPNKKTNVIFFGSNIGEQKSIFNKADAFYTIFPNRYPLTEKPICLSMKWRGEDKIESFWKVEEENLIKEFSDKIKPIVEENDNTHFSLFALAAMPLLIKLGSLFVDIVNVDVFQFMRNPKGWKWQNFPVGFELLVNEPDIKENTPVLVFSLSGEIVKDRVTAVLGENISIWEVTVPPEYGYNDSIRHPEQLEMFISKTRTLLEVIKALAGINTSLHIFPAMSVSCSVEFGRLRMPKADIPWVIYDQNNKERKFIKAITIGDNQ